MHTCDRCGYDSEHKQNLLRHLRNKTPCEPLVSDRSTQSILEELTKKNYNDVTYDCEHCQKKFNNRSSMYRHVKNCKHKIDIIEKLTTEMEALKKELQEVKKNTSSVNTQNIENQTTTNYSFHINNYGNETLDHLPNDFLTSCFMFKNILSLMENIHFDPDCPQNKNIKLQSLKHKLVKVYQDDKWIAKPADHVLDELVNKGQTILRRHYRNNREEVEEEMSKEEIDEVVNWLTQIFEDNEKIRRPLKHELVALLDTYR